MANTQLATVLDEDFTPGEREFISSRGQKTDLLSQENNLPVTAPESQPGDVATPAPAPAPTAPPGPAAPTEQLPEVGSPPLAPVDEADDDEPEPQIDPKTQQPTKPRLVNYGKYKKAKDAVSAMQAQLAEREAALREREVTQAKLEERLNLINEALAQPEPQQQEEELPPEPDPEQDIFGYVKWQRAVMARQERELAEVRQQMTSRAAQRQAEAEEAQTKARYGAESRQFAQTQPGYFGPQGIYDPAGAYGFMQLTRAKELALTQLGKNLDTGQKLTPEESSWLQEQINSEELGLVQAAHQRNVNPAELLYNMALGRGWKANGAAPPAAPPGASPPAAPPAAAVGNLANPPPAAATPSVADEIDRIIKGRAAGVSLSQGGGAPANELTPAHLNNLTEEEFFALLDEVDRNPAAKRRFQEAMGKM